MCSPTMKSIVAKRVNRLEGKLEGGIPGLKHVMKALDMVSAPCCITRIPAQHFFLAHRAVSCHAF